LRSTSPDLEGVAYSVDEHGGTYDHVPPPPGAATPDKASDPGENVSRFDRFGVRVPIIPAASPVISTTLPISDLQKSLITGTAAWSGMDSRGRFQGSRHDSTLSTSSLKEH
jgi:hypothetical protein